jgi:hypothetical protein
MTEKAWVPLTLTLPPTAVLVFVTNHPRQKHITRAMLSEKGVWLVPKPAWHRDRWERLSWGPAYWRHADG